MNTTASASGPAAASAAAATTAAAPSSPAFTPLETLLLFQSILKFGLDADAFLRISALLQNNVFVRSNDSYDASRLNAESLQTLFLRLLRDELIIPTGNGSGNDSSTDEVSGNPAQSQQPRWQHPLSPNSSAAALPKKRKLPVNPQTGLPTLYDALAHADQLTAFVERLYSRYRDVIVGSIREDERRFANVQAEIQLLEQEIGSGETEAERQQYGPPRQKETAATPATASGVDGKGALLAPRPTTAILGGTPANGSAEASHSTDSPFLASATTQSPEAMPQGRPPSGPTAEAAGRQPATASVPLLSAPSRVATHPFTEMPQSEPQQAISSLLPLPTATPPVPTGTTSSLPQSSAILATSLGAPTGIPETPLIQRLAQVPGHIPVDEARRSSSQAHSPVPSQAQQSATDIQPEERQRHLISTQAARLNTLLPVPSLSLSGVPTPNTPRMQMSAAASLSASPQVSSASQQSNRLPFSPVAAETADYGPDSQHLARPIAQKLPVATFSTGTTSQLSSGKQGPVSGSPTPQGATGHFAAVAPSASSRPLLPVGVRAPSRTPTPVQSPHPVLPHTPAQAAGFIPRGSGTRWKTGEPTTFTPGPSFGDIASPAYEPLSPIQPGVVSRAASAEGTEASSLSPLASGSLLRQSWHTKKPQLATRSRQRADAVSNRPRGGRSTRHSRVHSGADNSGGFPVKHEESTPTTALGDVTEMAAEDDNQDETTATSPHSRPLKRKRDESVGFFLSADSQPDPNPYVLARRRLVGPPTPPTHVLWTRGFPRISASALDQISSHRHANMFAHKIRDRDAPGYGSIVRHPVDLKSIRIAITQGNKAAIAMAATLPESDQQSASSVWLPISEDLVPPRGIVNSSQLECELMHMFANAVMYNPDSHRGPGPAFMAAPEAADDDAAGLAGGADGGSSGGGYGRYKVDEDGVVNDTRDMYVEVEKLLSEMRSAEKQRGAPLPPADAKGLDLPIDDAGLVGPGLASTLQGGGSDAEGPPAGPPGRGGEDAADDTATEGAGPRADAEEPGTTKRRRITRGQ